MATMTSANGKRGKCSELRQQWQGLGYEGGTVSS